jgi:hypothetical protein
VTWVTLLGEAGQSPESQSIKFECSDSQSYTRDVELRAMTSVADLLAACQPRVGDRVVVDLLDDFLQSQWRHISLSVV